MFLSGRRILAANILLLALFISILCFVDVALAYNCQSDVVSGNWSAAGSWTACNSTTPQPGDVVTILDGHVITLDASPSIDSIAIDNGGTLSADAGGRTLTLTAASGTLFTLGATGTFTSENSTVLMNPDAHVTLTSGAITFYNLQLIPIVGNDRTYTFGSGAITINNDLTVGNSTNTLTLALNTNDPALTIKGDLTLNSPSTWNKSASAALTLSPTGTKTFTDNNATKQDMGLVSISGGASTPKIELGSDMKVTNLTIGASHALDTTASNYHITLTGTSGTLFTLDPAGTFTPNNSTVLMDPDASVTLTSGEITFYNLQLIPTVGSDQTYTFGAGAVTMNNDLTVGNSTNNLTVALNTNNPVLTIKGNFTLNSPSTWNKSASAALTLSPMGTKIFTDNNVTKQDMGLVSISGGASTPKIDLGSDMKATNLTLAAGHILDTTASSYGITVSGNWANSGTFTANSGTVTFNTGTTSQVSGTTTFYDLTITHTGVKEVDFSTTAAHIIHVTNAFTVTGNSCNLIKLYSASAGTKWHFHPTGTASVTYADVKDGGCESGAISISPTNVTDSGNNESCWAMPVVIKGTVYSDEGTTPIGAGICDGSTSVVRIRDNGTSQNTSTICCPADSTYFYNFASFPSGNTMTVYLDDIASKATVVSLSSGSSLSGVDLYKDRVIVRHDNAGPVTSANLSLWDGSSEGDGVDGDVGFTVSSGNLTVSNTRELHVGTGKTFTPGGTVTTNVSVGSTGVSGDLHIASAATLSIGTNALSIGGDYTNAGTFSKSSGQTTTFTATSTGFNIIPGAAGTGNFDNLVFNGLGGGWSFGATAPYIDGDLTITNGALRNTSGTLTLKGNFNNSGTFTNNNGRITFTATTAGKTLSGAMTGTSAFYYLTFNGAGGSWIFNNDATTSYIQISNGTVTAPSGTLTLNGWFQNAGTFTHNSGTVVVSGGLISGSFAGTSGFYDLTLGGGAVSVNTLVNNNLTINGAVTGTGNITVNGGNIAGNGTMGMTSGALTLVGAGNFGGAGAWNLNNLTFGDGATTGTSASTGAGLVTVNGALIVSANHTLAGTKSFTVLGGVTGGGAINFTSGTLLQRLASSQSFGSTAGSNDWVFNNLTFTAPKETRAYICSNGFLSFPGDSYAYSIVAIPNAALPNGVIYGWWEDLNPSLGGTIKYKTFGTAPDRVFVTEFNNIQHYGGGYPVTFQIQLFEASNIIEVHYNGTSTTDADGTCEVLGVENRTGTVAVTDVNCQTSFSKTNTATRYTPSAGTYTKSTISLNWYDLSSGATSVSLSDDSLSSAITLPFAFGFFGVNVTATFASGGTGKTIVNGILSVGESNDAFSITVDNETNDRIIDANGDVNINSYGNLKASSSALFTVAGNWANPGTLTAGTGTVTFDKASGTQTLNGGGSGPTQAFYNLSLANGGTLKLVNDSSDVRGTLSWTSGTLDAGARNLYIGGDWTIADHFIPGTGGVIFDGSGTQTIYGDNTWYALAVTATAPRTVNFESGKTQAISANGSLTLEGGVSAVLTLAPLTALSPWNLYVDTTNVLQIVSNVAVSYSDAGLGTYAEIIASDGSNTDGGNNPNWCFSSCGSFNYRRRGAFMSFFE